MEVVRHDYKFMEQIFPFGPVLEHDCNKVAGNLFHLEQASLFQHIGGDKVCGFGGSSAIGNSQVLPQRLKPEEL